MYEEWIASYKQLFVEKHMNRIKAFFVLCTAPFAIVCIIFIVANPIPDFPCVKAGCIGFGVVLTIFILLAVGEKGWVNRIPHSKKNREARRAGLRNKLKNDCKIDIDAPHVLDEVIAYSLERLSNNSFWEPLKKIFYFGIAIFGCIPLANPVIEKTFFRILGFEEPTSSQNMISLIVLWVVFLALYAIVLFSCYVLFKICSLYYDTVFGNIKKYFLEDLREYKTKSICPHKPLSINQGQVLAISAAISLDNTDLVSFTWESYDEQIANVDSEGNVTGISEGTTIITGIANDERDARIVCTVQVEAPSPS